MFQCLTYVQKEEEGSCSNTSSIFFKISWGDSTLKLLSLLMLLFNLEYILGKHYFSFKNLMIIKCKRRRYKEVLFAKNRKEKRLRFYYQNHYAPLPLDTVYQGRSHDFLVQITSRTSFFQKKKKYFWVCCIILLFYLFSLLLSLFNSILCYFSLLAIIIILFSLIFISMESVSIGISCANNISCSIFLFYPHFLIALSSYFQNSSELSLANPSFRHIFRVNSVDLSLCVLILVILFLYRASLFLFSSSISTLRFS